MKLTDKSGYPDNGYADMQTLVVIVVGFSKHFMFMGD